MEKQKELSDPLSCLNKADPLEPIFILRAQDSLAVSVIRHWIMLARGAKVPRDKIKDVEHLISEFENWPVHKFPD